MTSAAPLGTTTQPAEDQRQQWRLPRQLFLALHARYDFDVDAAALAWNAQLDWFWSPVEDGLKQLADPKNDELAVYLNNPFDFIDPWAEVLHQRVLRGGFALQIAPVRTYTPWFYQHARRAEHHFFTKRDKKQGRVNFESPPGIEPSSNREPVMALVYDPYTWGKGLTFYVDAETGEFL